MQDSPHQTSSFEDLNRVELLHESPSSKEPTVVAPVLFPEIIGRHQDRELVPAHQLRDHLEISSFAIVLVSLLEHLRDVLAVVDDDEVTAKNREGQDATCGYSLAYRGCGVVTDEKYRMSGPTRHT